MKLFFHPIPVLTLCFLPAFAMLAALGVWQLERLQWKLGLIDEMTRNLSAAPIPIDRALAMQAKDAQYRHVSLTGRFDNAKEAYVYTTARDGAPVYHVVTPFTLDDGRVFLVDRGLVPPVLRAPGTRRAGELEGERHIAGIWRTPDAPGVFTPAPDLPHRIWYSRDLKGIAKTDGIVPAAPVIIEADAAPNPGGWPQGGQTVVDLPNDHLQYAITWFALAAGLIFVYLAYHRAQGRLGFRP
ncbi:MAG: SURF1 family protein [Rhizomicrobium sp.]|jgi:surfeit locus 1 family protein